jgi:pimeloyl-ACP methyl ester carboxylesterase
MSFQKHALIAGLVFMSPWWLAASDTPYEGFESLRVACPGELRGFVIVFPKEAAPGKPWIWRGSFWGERSYPSTEWTVRADRKLLEEGYHIVCAGPDIPLGAPSGNTRMDRVYAEALSSYGLAKKPALIGLSREALFTYRWAATNPEKVACIYIDNGDCDFRSWPGGMGAAARDPVNWAKVIESYGFESEADALAYRKQPIDILQPLAEARVPILHVAGTGDVVVPLEENAKIVKERYEAMGGPIELNEKPGSGHHPHGLEDPSPILDLFRKHTKQ